MSDAKWSRELMAQFPLPDNYEWGGGSGHEWPNLRVYEDVGGVSDTRWVYRYIDNIVLIYPRQSMKASSTYSVSSPEEAIALIYNLVLFGETS